MEKNPLPIPRHINNFLDWLDIEKGLSSKSQENYGRFIKKFVDWLKISKQEDLKPHELSPDIIWQYRVFLSRHSPTRLAGASAKRANHPLKKSTQNYYLIALRSLLNYFAERDIISVPAERVKLARDKGEKQVRFLTLEQLERLFAAPDISQIHGLRDRAILEVFFSTGLRLAELTALNRDQIRIKASTKEFELGIVGKGGKARTVYFSSRSIEWLKKYLDRRSDVEKALFASFHPVKQNIARRLSPRAVEKNLKKYALIAGLPTNTTPHVMRHSFATDLMNQGVDIRTVQEFLGHRSITATQIYTHVTNKRLKEIHSRFHGDKLKE